LEGVFYFASEKEEGAHITTSFDSEVGISGATDTAERRGAGGDPVIRKPKIALQGGKGKCGGIPGRRQ
jgi:hypothetical protein